MSRDAADTSVCATRGKGKLKRAPPRTANLIDSFGAAANQIYHFDLAVGVRPDGRSARTGAAEQRTRHSAHAGWQAEPQRIVAGNDSRVLGPGGSFRTSGAGGADGGDWGDA